MQQQTRYKVDFGPPPKDYVAGAGRGAVGFTTRSDIGPARAAPTPDQQKDGAPPGFQPRRKRNHGETERDYSDSNFDKFSGFGNEALFQSSVYDAEDKEADDVYEEIDRKMDSQRKKRREILREQKWDEYHKKHTKVHELFADCKKALSKLTESDWANIPESGDYTRKKHKGNSGRADKFTPVPDSIHMAGRREMQQSSHVLDVSGLDTPLSLQTPSPTPTDILKVGDARKSVLGITLSKLSDSVDGQTVVDPKGYLTDMKSIVSSVTDVSDIRKARALLKNVTQTNKKHAPGWLAYARVEVTAGKISRARNIIMEGCAACPQDEDVWLEAATLHPPEQARSILAQAVGKIPKSVKLWIRAADLEKDVEAKKAVLRRALEFIPNSVQLWKSTIQLEQEDDARVMLARAVECVPSSEELWLALAHLETYDKAKAVLNSAREAIPISHAIWIAAAKLEETHGKVNMIGHIVVNALKSLKHKVTIERETWLKEAVNCEKSGSPLTCQSIVRATLGLGIEEQDRRAIWVQDAKTYKAKGAIVTTRAIYGKLLQDFPHKQEFWWDAANFEKKFGSFEDLCNILDRGTTYCPEAESLWLMHAKEVWMKGQVNTARSILEKSFEFNPNSEEIWLAAVKLESETENPERARALLVNARKTCGTSRVWMKSCLLERTLKNDEAEYNLLQEALSQFRSAPKLWMMLAQFYARHRDYVKAHETYKKAVRHCPHSVPLWLSFAHSEERQGTLSKARSTLETARLRVPKAPALWLAAIKLEAKKNKTEGEKMLAKALQDCPEAGVLWAYAIETASAPKRKSKAYDALRKCSEDAHVFLAVAKGFWGDRRTEKARNWFERAVNANPDLGDAWAYFYKFLKQTSTSEKQKELEKRVEEASPRYGELWLQVSKKLGNERMKTSQILETVAAGIVVN